MSTQRYPTRSEQPIREQQPRTQVEAAKSSPFVATRIVDDPTACYFYHTLELPKFGVIDGAWDLRGTFLRLHRRCRSRRPPRA